MNLIDNLEEEIRNKSKEIYTDSLSMSIGELASMYKDKELELQPEYQRFFRWSNSQKTKFIESILLGIPIPPVFVYQKQDGIMAVVDGLQRLATIFQFMELLDLDDDREEKEEFKLLGTEFLPSLSERTWSGANSITQERKLIFKRARLDLKIIKYNSDIDAQFELFQRLNTGGSSLTQQEIRNSLMIMENNEFFNEFENLTKDIDFKGCLPLTKRSIDEKEDMEYAIRFLIYRDFSSIEVIKGTEDVAPYLTSRMIKIIRDKEFDFVNEKQIFIKTFELLNEILGEDSFKKYDYSKEKFVGPVSISLYEAIVPGISEYIKKHEDISREQKESLKDKIMKISNDENFIARKKAHRPILRMKNLIEYSREYFSDEY
ncbi:DUF262 domain-containing protein [Macrococcus equi]|uniref:DUF262 domain-containing protein n=1 Tax=Macrococcus equi TaxID=3395462 RepID=UPI0039BE5D78